MNLLMKNYMKQAERIIGKRTSEEIAHDDEVVAGLEMGLPIETALTNADEKHPSEALAWNSDNISDIAAHFDYLKEHAQIIRKMQSKKAK